MRILVLGVSGMLGHALFWELSSSAAFAVHGAARSLCGLEGVFPREQRERISVGIDADAGDSLVRALEIARPDVVINCIGLIKHLPIAADPLAAISINALFPHRLAHLCAAAGARLVHFSTDCVFDGKRGHYTEEDTADATDLYGRTKLLGEAAYPHCLTLRTSIIGHELQGRHGLLEWFLAQEGTVQGYTGAIYTGFPTAEIARILAEHVLPNKGLSGLYQVSSEPITKFRLLQLIAQEYGRQTVVEPSAEVSCDRSLDSGRFRRATGYVPPPWTELLRKMHAHYAACGYYHQRGPAVEDQR